MWIAVWIVAYLALGYLGSRETLKHETGEGIGFYIFMIFLGPLSACVGFIFWLQDAFQDRDVEGFWYRFFKVDRK